MLLHAHKLQIEGLSFFRRVRFALVYRSESLDISNQFFQRKSQLNLCRASPGSRQQLGGYRGVPLGVYSSNLSKDEQILCVALNGYECPRLRLI
jgi:hypothetical protein